MKNRGWQRLQWRYFLSYFILILVVIAILMVFAYGSFYRFHSQIVLGKYENGLAQIRSATEAEYTQLVSVTSQFTTSSNVSPFDFEEEPDRAVRLIRQLAIFKASTSSISELFLCFDMSSYLFSSRSSYFIDRFVHEAAIFENTSAAEMIDLFEHTTHLCVIPVQSVSGYMRNTHNLSRNVVQVFVPVRYTSSVKCGTAMYLIEEETYIERFTSSVGTDKDVYILDDETPLVSRRVSGIPEETVIAALRNGDSTITYNSLKYHLISLPGEDFKYSYVLLVSDRELGVAMTGSLTMMTLVAALALALGALFITRIVQSRIKPIKLLYSMLSDGSPRGGDLMEIRDAVQELIQENTAMSTKIGDMEYLQKGDFARRFLIGGFESEDDYLAAAEEIRINVDLHHFVVCIVAKPAQSDYELTADMLNHLFDEHVNGVTRTLGLNGKLAVIAFANDERALLDFLTVKFDGLRACCSGITMAMSDFHHGFSEGQRAYLEAENAFELRFIKGNASILRFDEQQTQNDGNAGYNHMVAERLGQALRANDPRRVQGALADISRAMRETQTSLFAFRLIYSDILNVVNVEARTIGKYEKEVYDLFQLSQCLSLDELDTLLHNACARLLEIRDTVPVPDVPDAVQKARELILRHFSEPNLSVSSIAQQAGMTDSRLSVEFKAAYRITPLEFLTGQRMKQARRLLISTDTPVRDISIECGYYDISAFNRRFKAYTGMTPQQYRQSNNADGDHADEA